MNERISLVVEDQLARVRLNRPEKHNALDLNMFKAITARQRELAKMKDIRAVILTGAGVDFCTGLDVKSIMNDPGAMRQLLWKWLPWRANLAQQVSVGWRRLPVPVIAAVQGRCWGGGMQIALGADFRIAQPASSLSIMEARWGLIPDMGGTLALRELMQRDQAMWLAMSAEEFSGKRGLELGLVTATADDPEKVAIELAAGLCEKSPDTVAAVKRLFRRSWTGSSGSALARETIFQLRIISGKNQRIAVRRQLGADSEYLPARRW
jgi:enoyl-CoA hydratase/carnithine racemase